VSNLQQVRIVPRFGYYVIEVVYKTDIKKADVNADNYLAIDIGLNNLATCISNIGDSFIINGKPLKSINQYFNKERAKLMSYVGSRGYSRKIDRLSYKRNMKIDDYIHESSAFIRNYCIKYKIGKVIVGKNKNWKQEVQLGKRTNQNFVNVPFEKLIWQLKYKLGDMGIEVIVHEERYTSKIDHLAFETMEHHEKYLGTRSKRGLFKSSVHKLINADINGAIGIMRKILGDINLPELINNKDIFNPIKVNILKVPKKNLANLSQEDS